MKSQKLLESFTAYCKANPEQRFWQALRNWNQETYPKENFILTAEIGNGMEDRYAKIVDTFYR